MFYHIYPESGYFLDVPALYKSGMITNNDIVIWCDISVSAAFGPDGRYIVFTVNEDPGESGVWLEFTIEYEDVYWGGGGIQIIRGDAEPLDPVVPDYNKLVSVFAGNEPGNADPDGTVSLSSGDVFSTLANTINTSTTQFFYYADEGSDIGTLLPGDAEIVYVPEKGHPDAITVERSPENALAWEINRNKSGSGYLSVTIGDTEYTMPVSVRGIGGDANRDGRVNGTDVQALILWINAGSPPDGRIDEAAARVAYDDGAKPNADDVLALILWINGGGKPLDGYSRFG